MSSDNKDFAGLSHEQKLELVLKSHDTAIAFGKDALKALMLINGGAAAALLALVSQVVRSAPGIIPALTPALGCFIVGLFLAGAATGLSYLAQTGYSLHTQNRMIGDWSASAKWQFMGRMAHLLAVALVVSGLLAFVWGAWTAAGALTQFKWPPVVAECKG